MKKTLTLVVSLVAILLFTVVARAADAECKHTNMTTTVEEQQADCYHTYSKTVTRKCNDCSYVTFEVTKGSAYKHGEIEVVDNSTPATCVANGWLAYSYVCKECGQIIGGGIQPIPQIAHPVDADGSQTCYEPRVRSVAGNCDSYGFIETTVWCTECNCEVSKTRETTPMTEHYWSSWVNHDGVAERHCITCGKIDTEISETVEMEPNAQLNQFRMIIEKIKMFFERILQFFLSIENNT